MTNPFLVGDVGPAAVVPADVARYLMVHLGHELSELRVRTRGVNQRVSFALLAIAEASASWVPLEELAVVVSEEQPRMWLSTTEAASVLEVGRRAVVMAIGRKQLPATRVGREWRLNRADVETYRAARAA